jgi:hypothetical protein
MSKIAKIFFFYANFNVFNTVNNLMIGGFEDDIKEAMSYIKGDREKLVNYFS